MASNDDTTLTDPLQLPISTDPEDIRLEQDAEMQTLVPGWRRVDGAPDDNLLAATAQTTAVTRAALADRVYSELLSLIGALFGLPRSDGTQAQSTITVTANDVLGHTLPAGTSVFLGDIELQTADELTITAGTDEGTVAIVAVEPGAAVNGATGALEVDALDWLDDPGVTLDDPLADGTDPETDVQYAIRLVEELQLVTFAPILPENFATRARRHPAVGVAWAINGYNHDTELTDQERTVTVVVGDDDAEDVTGGVIDEVQADLESTREEGFVVVVTNSTKTPVDVTGEIVPLPGWDPATAAANAQARIDTVLQPAQWVQPPFGVDPGYTPSRVLHVNELIAQADQADGVDYVTAMQIGDGSSDTLEFSDPVELPEPGTIEITPAS